MIVGLILSLSLSTSWLFSVSLKKVPTDSTPVIARLLEVKKLSSVAMKSVIASMLLRTTNQLLGRIAPESIALAKE
jgi:hypothetical protein